MVQPGWAAELNYMLRRKVAVVPIKPPALHPVKFKKFTHELLEDND